MFKSVFFFCEEGQEDGLLHEQLTPITIYAPELKDTRLMTCIVSLIGSSSPMGNCNHEKADTWVVVHVQHPLEHGGKDCSVRTVDMDVIDIFFQLSL